VLNEKNPEVAVKRGRPDKLSQGTTFLPVGITRDQFPPLDIPRKSLKFTQNGFRNGPRMADQGRGLPLVFVGRAGAQIGDIQIKKNRVSFGN